MGLALWLFQRVNKFRKSHDFVLSLAQKLTFSAIHVKQKIVFWVISDPQNSKFSSTMVKVFEIGLSKGVIIQSLKPLDAKYLWSLGPAVIMWVQWNSMENIITFQILQYSTSTIRSICYLEKFWHTNFERKFTVFP